MTREKLSTFTIVYLFQLLLTPLYAGSLKPLFFDSSKEQVLEDPADLKDLLVSYGKVNRPCANDVAKNCITYDFVVPKGFNLTEIKAKVQTVLALWNAIPGIGLKLDLGGVREMDGLYPAPTDSATINGNFVISFVAPNDEFKSRNRLLKVYNTAEYQEEFSEIIHSVIYINTSGSSVDFSSLIANGVGQSLGLSVSAVRKSVMSDEVLALKTVPALGNDDIQWMRYLYGSAESKNNFGSLSGKVLNGENNSPLSGAHIGVLKAADMDSFTQTLDRNLLVGSTFSNDLGVFVIPSLSAGDYVAVMEPRLNIMSGVIRFNSILDQLFSSLNFEPEFYDGAGRESNHEAALGFSPQGIQFAAILHIATGKETTGVEIITNSGDSKIEAIKAAGSSNETLSKIESAEKKFEATYEDSGDGDGGGGCNIQVRSASFMGTIFCLLIFALILGFQRRQGQKVKSSLFPFQKY